MSDGSKFVGVMQRLVSSVGRRLLAGMAAQAAAVTMRNEVDGDSVGLRCELVIIIVN